MKYRHITNDYILEQLVGRQQQLEQQYHEATVQVGLLRSLPEQDEGTALAIGKLETNLRSLDVFWDEVQKLIDAAKAEAKAEELRRKAAKAKREDGSAAAPEQRTNGGRPKASRPKVG